MSWEELVPFPLREAARLRKRRLETLEKLEAAVKTAEALRDEEIVVAVRGSREDLSEGVIQVRGKPTKDYQRQLRVIERLREEYWELYDAELKQQWLAEDAIQGFRSKARTILRMRYLEGRTWWSISAQFNLTVNASKNWLKRYLEDLARSRAAADQAADVEEENGQ